MATFTNRSQHGRRQPWEKVEGGWRKQTNAQLIELIKRSSTARSEGGFLYVTEERHKSLLDNGLYLPRE